MARLGRLVLLAALLASLLRFEVFLAPIPRCRLQTRPSLALGRTSVHEKAPRASRVSCAALPTLLAAGGAAALLLRQVVQRLGSNDSALRDLIARHTNIVIVDDFSSPPVASPSVPEPVCHGKSATELHWYVAPHSDSLPPVRWIIKKPTVLQRVLLEGGLGFAESYMDGEWDTDDLERLVFEMLKLENVRSELGWRVLPLISMIFWGALKWKVLPGNSLKGAQSNIANTYDVLNSPKLYEIMLGPTMQYTCAFYERPDMTLDEAQEAKMDLIAKKLDLRPGMRCLEFGFGFGAQAHYLASKYGVHVTGVTLSREQMAWAEEHNAHPNIEYRFQDYREVTGQYDRIYSVGMFEHVGRNSYETFFDKCYELLADDGIMLIHSMGWARRGPWNHNAFVNKYIFPGGEMPTMSHMTMEYSDRWHMEDWHSFGKSYVMTLRCWLERIREWKGLDELDNRFRRMWVYYLCACAAAFERRRVKLWQITYTKLAGSRPDDCLHIRTQSKPEMAASAAAV